MATQTKFRKVRLFKVSRELNVSVDTLVEHLEENGYSSALSGKGLNASINEEDAYLELLEAFADDKAVAARVKRKRDERRRAESSEEEEAAEVAAQPEAAAEPEPEPEPVAPEPVAPELGAPELLGLATERPTALRSTNVCVLSAEELLR
jgi:translation initiation factor IF-2